MDQALVAELSKVMQSAVMGYRADLQAAKSRVRALEHDLANAKRLASEIEEREHLDAEALEQKLNEAKTRYDEIRQKKPGTDYAKLGLIIPLMVGGCIVLVLISKRVPSPDPSLQRQRFSIPKERPFLKQKDVPSVDAPKAPLGAIKGLRFGMSVNAAIETLPELAEGRRSKLYLDGLSGSLQLFEVVRGDSSTVDLPGHRIRAITTLGRQPAECTFDFLQEMANDEFGLSRVYCRLGTEYVSTAAVAEATEEVGSVPYDSSDRYRGSYKNSHEHCRAWFEITNSLIRKYGVASESQRSVGEDRSKYGNVASRNCSGKLRWEGDGVILEVKSEEPEFLFQSALLSISSVTAKHLAKVEEHRRSADQLYEQKRRARERAKEERVDRRLRKLKKRERSLEDDL